MIIFFLLRHLGLLVAAGLLILLLILAGINSGSRTYYIWALVVLVLLAMTLRQKISNSRDR